MYTRSFSISLLLGIIMVCGALAQTLTSFTTQNEQGITASSTINQVIVPETKKLPSFSQFVKEAIESLEKKKTEGPHGYLMVDDYGKFTGVTETLSYQGTSYMWNECQPGEVVKINNKSYTPAGCSYCSGLTLEIFHKAMKLRDRYMGITPVKENWNGIGPKGIFVIKKLWNVIPIRYADTKQKVTDNPCPAVALQLSGIGRIITLGEPDKFELVQPYDFCDFSRSNGGGHSVIFLDWLRDEQNKITGFKYYSSQKYTQGQGVASEHFSDSGGKVLRDSFHIGRVYDDPAQDTPNQIREMDFVL